MRRARLQIRPNLGRSAIKSNPSAPQTSETSICSVSTANVAAESTPDNGCLVSCWQELPQENSAPKGINVPVDEEQPKVLQQKPVDEVKQLLTVPSASSAVNTSDLGSKAPIRRSRLKPQVSIRQRANAAENDVKPVISAQPDVRIAAPAIVQPSVKQTEVIDNSSKDVVPTSPRTDANLPQNVVGVVQSDVEKTSAAELPRGITEKVLSQLDTAVDDEKCCNVEPVAKTTALRRPRFSHITPNLTEAARRTRVRHPSASAPDVVNIDVMLPSIPQSPISSSTDESCTADAVCVLPTSNKMVDENVEVINEEVVVNSTSVATKHKAVQVKTVVNFLGTPTDKLLPERCKRRKLETLSTDVDRSKLTMRDLIYMNPVDNKMKEAMAELEAKKSSSTTGSGGGEEHFPPSSDPPPDDATITTSREDEEDNAEVMKEGGDAVKKAEDRAGDEEEEEMPVPQVTIGPDGEIIINQCSLVVPTKAPKESELGEATEEKEYSIGCAYGRKTPSKFWANKETKRFYVALSMCGTDFSLMSNFFRKRTRVELKRKFKREERYNRHLVEVALKEHRVFDVGLIQDLSSSDDEPEIKPPKEKKPRKPRKTTKGSNMEKENVADKATDKKLSAAAKKTKKKKTLKGLYYDDTSEDEAAADSNLPSDTNNEKEDDEQREPPDADDQQQQNSDIEEVEVVNVTQKRTRYGRQPKPVRAFVEETPPPTKRRTAPQLQSPLIQLVNTPSRAFVLPQTSKPPLRVSPSSRSPRMMMSPPAPPRLGSIGAMSPQIDMGVVQPGQLIFVTSTPPQPEGSDAQTKPAQVIHVYMVAPPGEKPSPSGSVPSTEQRILKSPPLT